MHWVEIGSSILIVFSYWLVTAQGKYGLPSNSVSDTQTVAAAVFQLNVFLVADTFLKGILSGTPPWLPHKCTILSALINKLGRVDT